MSTGLAGIAMVGVGIQLALQAPINSALGAHVGRLAASLISFLVGTLILVLLVVLSGELSRVGELGSVPPPQLLGGVIGAIYVAVATLTVARIGAGAVVAATVTGQLLSSLLIDDLGLIGVEVIALDAVRAAGAALLVVGTLLVVGRDRGSAGRGRLRSNLIAAVAVFVAGLLVGIQHPVNGLLSESSGELVAGLCNFVVGGVFLATIVLITGRGARLGAARRAPAWQFLGGPIGVVTVVGALAAVSVIGAAGLAATLITGQLIGSIAIDRVGAFGLPVRLITTGRALGVALLLAGTAMCAL